MDGHNPKSRPLSYGERPVKRGKMLRLGIMASLLLTGLGSTGCTTPSGNVNNTGTDALVGGGLGAGAGALIGAAAHAPVAGALIGGALGAGTGAAIGSSQDRQDQRQAFNASVAQAQAQAQARLLQPFDVVQMTKNGLDETVIINQIRTSGCAPLDPPNLNYLQQSGVSARVISEMQQAGARPYGPVVVAGMPPPPPPAVVVAPGYYYGYRRGWGY